VAEGIEGFVEGLLAGLDRRGDGVSRRRAEAELSRCDDIA
jgi:hypothetical protein